MVTSWLCVCRIEDEGGGAKIHVISSLMSDQRRDSGRFIVDIYNC